MRRAPKTVLAVAATALAGLLAVQIVFSGRSLAAAYYATLGDAAQRTEDVESARKAFAKAQAAVPFNADYVRLEAAATGATQGKEAAVPLFTESLRRSPFAPLTLSAAAETYVDLQRYDDAKAVLARIERVTPDDWRFHYLRGLINFHDGNLPDAVNELKTATRIGDPPQFSAFYELANASYVNGDFLTAERAAAQAIRLQPLSPELRMIHAKALLSRNEITEARKELAYCVQVYQKRLQTDENAHALLIEAEGLLAVAYLAEGRFDDAYSTLDTLHTRLTPDQIDSFALRLNELAGRMSDPFPPVSFWARALDQMVQTGHGKEFEDTLASVRMLMPESELGELVPPRGRALTAAGHPDEAIALLATAPTAVRKSPQYHFALAEAHAAAGHPVPARREYETLLGQADLAPVIRQQAQAGLAKLPAQ